MSPVEVSVFQKPQNLGFSNEFWKRCSHIRYLGSRARCRADTWAGQHVC